MKNVEIVATLQTERIRWGETAIFNAIAQANEKQCDKTSLEFQDMAEFTFGVKITAAEGEIENGLTYRLFGHWTEYANKRTGKAERTFVAKTFVRSQPFDMLGTLAYLRAAGVGNGLGPARARDAWDAWGADCLAVLRDQPEIAAERLKLKEGQARAVSEWLKREKDLEATTIDLLSLFDRRGFPKRLIQEVVREYGNRAKEVIQRNPYVLMKFSGVGFTRADQLYLSLGLSPGRVKRQALCAWNELAKDSSGHTWFPIEKAAGAIHASVAGATPDPIKAMKLAKRAGLIAIKKHEGKYLVAVKQAADAEQNVADQIERLERRYGGRWPVDLEAMNVSEHQRNQLMRAINGSVGLLLGGPGTGKTYTSAALIRELDRAVGIEKVAVCAPTGKAAVRLTQAMKSNGITINAQTIHSLLQVRSMKGGDWEFEFCQDNPLPYSFLIVDESSMIDCGLMSCLLQAIPTGGKVLFVGDPNQLPPVGHGAPLRDFISGGVASGELTEIRRNSGRIVTACHSIRRGEQFEVSPAFDPDAEFPENLRLVQAFDDPSKIAAMFKVLDTLKHKDFDRVWDCQIIAAVNEKGELSRKKLNRILQTALNDQPEVVGSPFKTRDKVVCVKNGEFERADRDGEKKYVANGEQGKVIECSAKLMLIELGDKSVVKVPRGSGGGDSASDGGEGGGPTGEESSASDTGCNWDLAYAVSCHKSQGSEWPFVVVMLDESGAARQVCSREWIYTAISRAKVGCFLVGNYQTAAAMARRVAFDKRVTLLSELLREKLGELVPF